MRSTILKAEANKKSSLYNGKWNQLPVCVCMFLLFQNDMKTCMHYELRRKVPSPFGPNY
jgi:hypothetical protein